MDSIITVKAQLINKGTNNPLSKDGTVVKLYDQDLITDDFLGQSQVNDSGVVYISFETSDFRSSDSIGEKYPDLYFEVYKYGKLLFKSSVLKNFNLESNTSNDPAKGKVIDLGVFMVGE